MKQLTRAKKLKIFKRDDFQCQICGTTIVCDLKTSPWENHYGNVDHLIQRVRKGSNSAENLVTTCRKCNLKRGKRKSQDIIRLGCSKNDDFIGNLINYEMAYDIFDKELFTEQLLAYKAEIQREIDTFNKITRLLEENQHES